MHCPSCFDKNWNESHCSICGYKPREHREGIFLSVGTILHDGEYIIGKVLGRPGGFGITYLAWDTRLDLKVAIKEYLPLQIAGRAINGKSITVHTEEYIEGFKFGLEKFLEEAKILAHFRHSNVVRVMNFFRENGTAYMVMDYLEGQSLGEYLEKIGRINGPDAVAMFAPVLDGVAHIHSRNFIHRDIKPSNIYLTNEGQLILLDFGSARQAFCDRSQSMTTIVTPGFAPWEQYHRKGKQGPWTDVYACAATLYAMVTGQAPTDGTERIIEDDLASVESIVKDIDKNLAESIRRGLSVNPEERPQTAGEFQKMLLSGQVNEKNQVEPLQGNHSKQNQAKVEGKSANDVKKVENFGAEKIEQTNNRILVLAAPNATDASYSLKAPIAGYVKSIMPKGSSVNKGMVVFVICATKNGANGVAVTTDRDGIVYDIMHNIEDFAEKGTRIIFFRPTQTKSNNENKKNEIDNDIKPNGNLAPKIHDKVDGEQQSNGNSKTKMWTITIAVLLAVSVSFYMNGNVTWTSSDGTYSGPVRWGTRHGNGTIIFKDGSRLNATWDNGNIVGSAELILQNGTKYMGNFYFSHKRAEIQLTDGSRYQGGFENNNFNGKGTLIRPNGAKYEGEFSDGKKNGIGILQMPDGSKYEGEFRNDELNGKTKITKPNAEIIEGVFSSGKQDGEFKRFPPNNSDESGLVFVSTWRNGIQNGKEEVRAPVSLGDIKTGNFNKGEGVTDWNTRFSKSQVRYIHYAATVSSESPHTISGEILVKYIQPNGYVKRNANISPAGGSITEKTNGYGRIGMGWGNSDVSIYEYGRHYIQFFWKGIQIGETYFDVY